MKLRRIEMVPIFWATLYITIISHYSLAGWLHLICIYSGQHVGLLFARSVLAIVFRHSTARSSTRGLTHIAWNSNYTVNHKEWHPFYFGNNLAKCWPNFTVFGRNVAKKIFNIFMLCCTPHLHVFSLVMLLQENAMSFNYVCASEFVPLTAAVILMIKTYGLNKTIQICSAYVSVITVYIYLSLIHIWRCRRIERCRSRWSPYH